MTASRKREGGEMERERIQVGNREEGLEVILVVRHVLRSNIRVAPLPKWGKLHIDVFTEIVDDEPLFIVSKYCAHHVLVPIIFLSQ